MKLNNLLSRISIPALIVGLILPFILSFLVSGIEEGIFEAPSVWTGSPEAQELPKIVIIGGVVLFVMIVVKAYLVTLIADRRAVATLSVLAILGAIEVMTSGVLKVPELAELSLKWKFIYVCTFIGILIFDALAYSIGYYFGRWSRPTKGI